MEFPTVENSVLVVIDLQQKLMPVISNGEEVVSRTVRLLHGAAALGMDVIASEQYPKGLGSTLPEVSTWFPEKSVIAAKTSFSVFGEAEFMRALNARKRKVMIFAGVETHVCVLQSVIDALQNGYEVIVAADAVGSRRESDKIYALEMIRQLGGAVLSSEAILFMLLRSAGNPAFKSISKLVK